MSCGWVGTASIAACGPSGCGGGEGPAGAGGDACGIPAPTGLAMLLAAAWFAAEPRLDGSRLILDGQHRHLSCTMRPILASKHCCTRCCTCQLAMIFPRGAKLPGDKRSQRGFDILQACDQLLRRDGIDRTDRLQFLQHRTVLFQVGSGQRHNVAWRALWIRGGRIELGAPGHRCRSSRYRNSRGHLSRSRACGVDQRFANRDIHLVHRRCPHPWHRLAPDGNQRERSYEY